MVNVEVHLFNALRKYAKGGVQWLHVPRRALITEILSQLEVPEAEVFLALHNGRNIMRGFGFQSGIDSPPELAEGDRFAFSGAVPFSRGYGSPVV